MTNTQCHNTAGISTVIVAHAPQVDISPFVPLLQKADLLIAADGGANHLHRAGIRPHIIIGDLDSVEAATMTWLHQSACQIMQLPREKDETDLEVALLLACERQSHHIDILGATGGRLDHTLANIAMLGMDELAGCPIHLLDHSHELILVRAGEQCGIHGQPGDTVSLLPLSSRVSGVTIQGFYYPLQDATLFAHRARGISNILLHSHGYITLTQGLLIVIHHFDNGAHQANGSIVQQHLASHHLHTHTLDGGTAP